ncbi:homoserine dehydrogenase [Candidatus Neomarinimicrobiota bacterium]
MNDSSMFARLGSLTENIRVAIIGAGAMGKGLFYQCHITPGMQCVAIADIDIDKCIACVEWLGYEYKVVSTLDELHDTIQRGMVAICEDGELLSRCASATVLIESSSSIRDAGRFAVTALEHRKHLILMNAEIDLIFGPYFKSLAHKNGVVYTSCDGDQHTVIKRLTNDLQLWGFDLVMAGNIKGFLDRYSNPTKIIPEADKRHLDYKMATAYTDGTKLCIEMALVANNLGLSTAVPGMQGPRVNHVHEVFDCFDLPALWDNKQPVVDYILGAEPGGGVFVIGHGDNKYQQEMLTYYKMGQGPFYLFYRPYHLCHIEAMACIAEAALDGYALLQPSGGFQTNVYTYAKRDLRQGELLDGVGGYTCYGLIENCADNLESPGLPICLADGVTLKRDVNRDEKILMTDVSYDPQSFEFDLFSKAQEHSIR